MIPTRRLFSVCIPAYNRAHFLRELLDSIFAQDFEDFEVVICEDCSPQRQQIAAIAHEYRSRYPERLRYFENEANLGYDGNIRNLVEKASGQFCFFMGNDDLMCPGALRNVAGLIQRFPKVGVVLKSYGIFYETPQKVTQEIRWFTERKSSRRELYRFALHFGARELFPDTLFIGPVRMRRQLKGSMGPFTIKCI